MQQERQSKDHLDADGLWLTTEDGPLPASDVSQSSLAEQEPEFKDEPVDTDSAGGIDDGEPYFPPTDPVITSDRHGRTQVLGGTGPTALDPVAEPAASAEDSQPGDVALEDAVRRELRLDAATTDLAPAVRISVREGVAYLRGSAPSLEDAENAEAVAARVPGVLDVVEDLTVPGL